MAVIGLEKVSKQYGASVAALESVDLAIEEGEFVSIIGSSGCGKTTLLRIVSGLEPPTMGTVTVCGGTPMEACRRREIGVAFQRPALVPSRTALANVRLTLDVVGENGALSPESLLDEFGLVGFFDHYPHQLSGGMQQRVNIACALVHQPKILLLDEPFGALDEITRESMVRWLSGILDGVGRTVILVTHSVDEAVTLSDRVVVMSAGPGSIASDLAINRDAAHGAKTDLLYQREASRVREALGR